MVDKLRDRILNWDPTKDAVFPMLDCHALHIYLACGARDDYKILPESLIFDARKSDKWLQWTDMVDVCINNVCVILYRIFQKSLFIFFFIFI
jgi:hypothetical protein